jgi:predicted TIM-barrel fold metal-dependent hydrolase
MTIVDDAVGSAPDTRVSYGLYDADEHYYEAEDAVTRHLDREHRHAFRWVDIGGRRTVIINDKLFKLVPNPTYDPVGRPGSMVEYFRGHNHEGRSLKELVGELQRVQPEYRDRTARLAMMDAQGVDFTWLVPSLGLGLEEPLASNPAALHAVVRSFNRWLDEDWGFDRDGRIQAGALLSLVDPAEAEAELARVLDAGARLILMRPAPVASIQGPRSLGHPAHDRFWSMCEEAGVVVGFHAADSGYGAYATAWGEGANFEGWKGAPLSEIMSVHVERPIFDAMAAMVAHGVYDRHPALKVAVLELGAAWIPDLFRKMKMAYGKMPGVFGRDPIESFREHVWVAPFYEDDIEEIAGLIGTDHVLFGSDWPHPEGTATPIEWIEDIAGFSPADTRSIMRDNLATLTGRCEEPRA